MLATITWVADRGIELGPLFVRYYQVFFFLGFFFGYRWMKKVFVKEGVDLSILDALLSTMVVATVVGARLGHVFFYDWGYYREHVAEIFMPWKGGLASHGAAVSIVLAMLWFGQKYLKPIGKSSLWMLDRVVITVALAGAFIRLGNFTNSEIYGQPQNSALETVFVRNITDYVERYFARDVAEVQYVATGNHLQTDSLKLPEYELRFTPTANASLDGVQSMVELYLEPLVNRQTADNRHLYLPQDQLVREEGGAYVLTAYGIPRAPSQLYEALAYALIYVLLLVLFQRGAAAREGQIFGVFLTAVFGFRFVIEFIKANQKDFESGMDWNMGQWLSIPLVVAGLFFLIRSLKTPKSAS
jgi:prolipoprotein diacylglyceryltransferase